MAKYAFNNDAQRLSDVIGITEERFDELNNAVKKTAMAAFFVDKNISNVGLALEMLINEAQPVGEVEAMLLGYMYGSTSEKARRLVNRLSEVIDTYK